MELLRLHSREDFALHAAEARPHVHATLPLPLPLLGGFGSGRPRPPPVGLPLAVAGVLVGGGLLRLGPGSGGSGQFRPRRRAHGRRAGRAAGVGAGAAGREVVARVDRVPDELAVLAADADAAGRARGDVLVVQPLRLLLYPLRGRRADDGCSIAIASSSSSTSFPADPVSSRFVGRRRAAALLGNHTIAAVAPGFARVSPGWGRPLEVVRRGRRERRGRAIFGGGCLARGGEGRGREVGDEALLERAHVEVEVQILVAVCAL
mmetsp:Transcript_3500/g.6971  ORF Transcript_3500/g.6971 Transcript_3500/m.6971 type:complete len:263 (-) Transcript_3500:537-1325(-)